MIRVPLLLLAALIAFGIVLPIAETTRKTWSFSSSTNGLIIIALLDEDEWTFNPWSKDGLFLSPDAAMRHLLDSTHVRKNCKAGSFPINSCEITTVALIGRSLDDPTKRTRPLKLLHHFIAIGEPVDEISQGLTPLHEAVLYSDIEYLGILVKAKANPYIQATSASKSASGLTPREFCMKLEAKKAGERAKLCEALALEERRSSLRPSEPSP